MTRLSRHRHCFRVASVTRAIRLLAAAAACGPRQLAVSAAGLLLLAAPQRGFAQQLSFQHLTVRDGLTSNYVTALEQGARGRLWIGTADGIAVYDGDRCTTITKRDGLPGNYIARLLTRRKGGMYAVAGGRVVMIASDGRVRPLPPRSGNTPPIVADLAETPDGRVWAASGDGLLRIIGDTLVHVEGTALLGVAHCLRADTQGRLWLLDRDRVRIFDPSSGRLRCADSLPGVYGNIYCIREGKPGQMLVCARDSSVTEFRDGRVYRRHHFSEAQPQDLLRDENGTWWIGTNVGLYSVQESGRSLRAAVFHEFRDNFSGIEINVLLQDRERNIWYGSAGMGVGWLEDRATQYFRARDMTGTGTQDGRGRIWLGSHQGIWECWREAAGVWKRRLHQRTAKWPSGYSYHIQVKDNRLLYVSFSGGGIAEFDIAREPSPTAALTLLRVVAPSRVLPTPDSFCFLVDRHNLLWMKTRDGDIVVASLDRPAELLRRIRTPHPDIRVIFEDADGSVWIGGYDAPPVVFAGADPARAAPRVRGDLGAISIRALLRDGPRLWIGSMNGVRLLENGRWHAITSDDGLPNDRVFALASGVDGRLWLGTQTGMVAYDPGTRWIDSQIEFTDNPVGACGMLGDGILWLATAFGLTVHDTKRSAADTVAPRLYLRAFFVNDRLNELSPGSSFSSTENNLRFEFLVPHLRRSRHVRLEYRLVGIDSAWSAPTEERSISFRALPSGDYELLVRARNSTGIASPRPLALHFHIRPPLWAEWWFIAGAVLLLAGTAAVALRMRLRRLLETERMRSRIAADLHDDIGTGLTRIAMMSDMMQQQAGIIRSGHGNAEDVHSALASTLQRTGTIARELIENMSDVVWSLDPRNEAVMSLAERLRVFAYDLTEAREIGLVFEIDDSLRQVKAGSEVSRSVLMVMKEALNNAVRHASPSTLRVRLHITDNRLHFSVADDGHGFDTAADSRRSGLRHMEERMASCGGTLALRSGAGAGTVIEGSAPLQVKN